MDRTDFPLDLCTVLKMYYVYLLDSEAGNVSKVNPPIIYWPIIFLTHVDLGPTVTVRDLVKC